MKTKTMNAISSLAIVGMFCLSAAASSYGQVLYNENFDSMTVGTSPAGWTNSGNWKVSNTASSSPNNSYWASDSSSSSFQLTIRPFTSYVALDSATKINLQFDLRIDNYQSLTAGSASTFRVALQADATAAHQYAIGLGYNNVGGSSTLFFYGDDAAAPTPSASNAIGYQAETGFVNGFNLGAMGSGTTNGTGGNFYRFNLTYDSSSGAVNIVATNLTNPEETTTYSDVWSAKYAITSAGRLVLTTGNLAQGNMYVDNIQLAVVPEPSSLALLASFAAAALAFGSRRRSRKNR